MYRLPEYPLTTEIGSQEELLGALKRPGKLFIDDGLTHVKS